MAGLRPSPRAGKHVSYQTRGWKVLQHRYVPENANISLVHLLLLRLTYIAESWMVLMGCGACKLQLHVRRQGD